MEFKFSRINIYNKKPDAESRKDEIVEVVRSVNCGKLPLRFMGRAFRENT